MRERRGAAGSRWALVTGGSRGIGRALARCLASDGFDLILVARGEDRLREVADELEGAHGIDALVCVADLSDPEAPEEVVRFMEARDVRPDVVVNNAGFGDFGPFHEAAAERLLDMVRVNVTGLTHLTRLCLSDMVEAGGGRILNVASTAAFQPGPLMAVYYATKAYVLSLSEALAEELRGTGVSVTCLCPGPTRTGFHSRAEMEDSGLLRLGLMDADAVARRGHRGMLRGERVVVPGLMNRLGSLLARILPGTLVTRLVKAIQKPVA